MVEAPRCLWRRYARAKRTAIITASLPELAKRMRSRAGRRGSDGLGELDLRSASARSTPFRAALRADALDTRGARGPARATSR
jgi:hypothetical protein